MRSVGLLSGFLLPACIGFCADFFVAPGGRPGAAGSMTDPWDLATALGHPSAVRPGDTIWVRGGTYRGQFRSRLTGLKSQPITVRRYRDERPVIDGAGSQYGALLIEGARTWYWGLEVTNSSSNRIIKNFNSCYPNCRASGVTVFGQEVKCINMVVHDTGEGFGLWTPAIDAELYGNIILYTGWQSDLRGHGHGIYMQNNSGTKQVLDNVILAGFHTGINAYGGSDASLKNMQIEGNVIFNNGLLAEDPVGFGILVGGTNLAENITISRNYLYNPTWYSRSNNLNPSYGNGTTSLVLEDNYSAGATVLRYDKPVGTLRATGNTFVGNVDRLAQSQLQQQAGINTIMNSPLLNSGPVAGPSTNKIFVRRNKYEPDKAIIVIYNWANQAEVAVDLGSVLRPGDNFEIVDVQNLFGDAVASGRFEGKPVPIPMNSPSGKPVGEVPGKRYRSTSEFGVFQMAVRAATVQPTRKLSTTKAGLRFSYRIEGDIPPAQYFTVIGAEDAKLPWISSVSQPWLQAQMEKGQTPSKMRVKVLPQDLAAGAYEGEIAIRTDEGERLAIPVVLQVLDSGAAPVIDAIFSGASQESPVSGATWVTIAGANLARSTRKASSEEGIERLPSELEGVHVRIGGKPAFLSMVSPTKIEALAQDLNTPDTDRDQVEVIVETGEGTAQSTAPWVARTVALFLQDAGEPGMIAANHPDGTLVGPEGMLPETPARPARKGDQISLFATGLDASDYVLGNLLPAALPILGDVEVILGETAAEVNYAGMIGPGLAKMNIIVPELAAGSHGVVLRYRGLRSQAAAFLAIAE